MEMKRLPEILSKYDESEEDIYTPAKSNLIRKVFGTRYYNRIIYAGTSGNDLQ